MTLTPDEFNQLETDDACRIVLQLLVSDQKHAAISRGNPRFPDGIEPLLERSFQQGTVFSSYPDFSGRNYAAINQQLSVAWQYAHQKQYLYGGDQEGFSKLSQQGIDFAKKELRVQDVTQLDCFHASIQAKVQSQFRVGKNSDAIGLAFNEVESVAKERAWPSAKPPVSGWIQNAFGIADPEKGTSDGPLVNSSYSKNEKRSVYNLFRGAFGLYRNPHAHQNPVVSEEETLRVLGLASLLMVEIDKV